MPTYSQMQHLNVSNLSIWQFSSLATKLRRILHPGIAIRKKFAPLWIIRVWTYDEFPEVFGSTPNRIPLKTRKCPNVIRYLPKCYLIFASRLNTSTSNHHFFASSTIQLRLQRFASTMNLEAGPHFAEISSLVCADFCLNFCFSYTRDGSNGFLLRHTFLQLRHS